MKNFQIVISFLICLLIIAGCNNKSNEKIDEQYFKDNETVKYGLTLSEIIDYSRYYVLDWDEEIGSLKNIQPEQVEDLKFSETIWGEANITQEMIDIYNYAFWDHPSDKYRFTAIKEDPSNSTRKSI